MICSYTYRKTPWSALRVAIGFVLLRTIYMLAPWRVMPRDHPARIFWEGRTCNALPLLDDALAPRSARGWLRVAIAATTIVFALAIVHAFIHTSGLNPLEGVFDRGHQHITRHHIYR